MRAVAAASDDPAAAAEVSAERAMLVVLDGSCRTPIGGLARRAMRRDFICAGWSLVRTARVCWRASARGPADGAEAMGEDLGRELRSRAGSGFFERLSPVMNRPMRLLGHAAGGRRGGARRGVCAPRTSRCWSSQCCGSSTLDGPPLDLAGVQALLATSANGVRAFARRNEQRDVRVLAVGDATARAARAAGFTSVESAGGDVARWPNSPAGDSIPQAGRSCTSAATRGRGRPRRRARRRRVRLPTRGVVRGMRPPTGFPTSSPRTSAEAAIDAVLVFSPRTGATLVRLLRAGGLSAAARELICFCLSHAVAAAVAPLPWRRVVVAAQPTQTAMIAAIAAGTNPLAPIKRRRIRSPRAARSRLLSQIQYRPAARGRRHEQRDDQGSASRGRGDASSERAVPAEPEAAERHETEAPETPATAEARSDASSTERVIAQPASDPSPTEPIAAESASPMPPGSGGRRGWRYARGRPYRRCQFTAGGSPAAFAPVEPAFFSGPSWPSCSSPRQEPSPTSAISSRVSDNSPKPSRPICRPRPMRRSRTWKPGKCVCDSRWRDWRRGSTRSSDTLAALRQSVDKLATTEQAADPELVKQLGDRIALLEAQAGAASGLAQQVRSLEASTAVARDTASKLAATVLARRVNWRRRSPTVAPFVRQLAAVRALGGDDPDIAQAAAELEPHAISGVPTLAALRAQLPATVDAVIRATPVTAGEAWTDRVMDRLASLVSIRRVGPTRSPPAASTASSHRPKPPCRAAICRPP